MILLFKEILFHRKAPHIFFPISNEYFHWIAKYVMFSIRLISIESVLFELFVSFREY